MIPYVNFLSLLTAKIICNMVLIWRHGSLGIRIKKKNTNNKKAPNTRLHVFFLPSHSLKICSFLFHIIMSLCNTHQTLTIIYSTAWPQMELLPVQLLSYRTVYLCLNSLFFLACISLRKKKIIHFLILPNFSLPQFLYYLLFRSVTVLFNSMKCLWIQF